MQDASTNPPYRVADTTNQQIPWNPRAVRAFAIGFSAIFVLPLAFMVLMLAQGMRGTGVTLLLVGASVASFVLGLVAIVRGVRARREIPTFPIDARGKWLATAAIPLGVLGTLFSALGMFSAFLSTIQFSRGRQLRRRGALLLPRVGRGDGWTHTTHSTPSVDPSLREALAAQWRENGRTEHASVAAFARLTLDLIALGAPSALLAAAQRDAHDEVRHAELCFSLAHALDGRDEGPMAFPEAAAAPARSRVRTLALAELAVDSLIDGALHEGVSARVIARLAKGCEDEATRAVLKQLAADEGRHAAHGWDVATWCLAEGGAPVAHALRGAVAQLPRSQRSPLPAGAAEGAWERWGIHGHALEAEEFAATREALVARVARITAPVLGVA